MKHVSFLIMSLTLGSAFAAEGPSKKLNSPSQINFKMARSTKSFDCSAVYQALDVVLKKDCINYPNNIGCYGGLKSLKANSVLPDANDPMAVSFSASYGFDPINHIAIENYGALETDFQNEYVTTVAIENVSALSLGYVSKRNVDLAKLMSVLQLQDNISLYSGGYTVPQMIIKNKLLACELENGNLKLFANGPLQVTTESPMKNEKYQIIDKVKKQYLSLKDAKINDQEKYFSLGVSVAMILKESALKVSDQSDCLRLGMNLNRMLMNTRSGVFSIHESNVNESVERILKDVFEVKNVTIDFSL